MHRQKGANKIQEKLCTIFQFYFGKISFFLKHDIVPKIEQYIQNKHISTHRLPRSLQTFVYMRKNGKM